MPRQIARGLAFPAGHIQHAAVGRRDEAQQARHQRITCGPGVLAGLGAIAKVGVVTTAVVGNQLWTEHRRVIKLVDVGIQCSRSRSEEHTYELPSLMRISYAV